MFVSWALKIEVSPLRAFSQGILHHPPFQRRLQLAARPLQFFPEAKNRHKSEHFVLEDAESADRARDYLDQRSRINRWSKWLWALGTRPPGTSPASFKLCPSILAPTGNPRVPRGRFLSSGPVPLWGYSVRDVTGTDLCQIGATPSSFPDHPVLREGRDRLARWENVLHVSGGWHAQEPPAEREPQGLLFHIQLHENRAIHCPATRTANQFRVRKWRQKLGGPALSVPSKHDRSHYWRGKSALRP